MVNLLEHAPLWKPVCILFIVLQNKILLCISLYYVYLHNEKMLSTAFLEVQGTPALITVAMPCCGNLSCLARIKQVLILVKCSVGHCCTTRSGIQLPQSWVVTAPGHYN